MLTMSLTRKRYFIHLLSRIGIFLVCLVLYFNRPQVFEILEGTNFLTRFSVFHLLWLIWMWDMIQQIIPIKNKVALGSQKLFAHRFRPVSAKRDDEKLKVWRQMANRGALKVGIVWSIFISVITAIYFNGGITKIGLFLITVFFYVCDLICVLIWCPFRLIMKNKCCTTCRIFNWDHLMMFSPLLFVGGIFASSLVFMAFLTCLVWEVCIALYPERFCETTNEALKCSSCTDKLCTQYCEKKGG